MLRLCFILFFVAIASFSYAQHAQEGVVFENKTHVALAGINIVNLNGKHRSVTDKQGRFSVAAKVNDLLVFEGFGYKPDTVVVIDMRAREIFMDPIQHLLSEVEINGKGASGVNPSAFKQTKDIDFHNQTMTYQRNANGTIKGGISLRVWSNNKTENEAKKREEEAKNDKVSLEISKVFSKDNIVTYLPLKDKELDGFIIRYSPDVDTYTSSEFHLPTYLNKCYKEFMTLPPDERQKTSIFN